MKNEADQVKLSQAKPGEAKRSRPKRCSEERNLPTGLPTDCLRTCVLTASHTRPVNAVLSEAKMNPANSRKCYQ